MTAVLFITFVVVMAIIVVALVARHVNTKSAVIVAIGLAVWFLYTGLLGYLGVIRNPAIRPPAVLLIIGPVLLFSIGFVLASGRQTSLRLFPLWVIIATQSFRVIVELFLHQMWHLGLIPKMLTFEGANVDIFIGASAPLIAWLSTRGRLGTTVALIWNLLGLIALANVVTRSILTTPGPLNRIHAELPNQLMGLFPYLYIPAFFVPLAVVLHVVAMRNPVARATSP